MKLICEINESVNFIVEKKESGKDIFIEGIFMQGNIVNRNKRFYPVETLDREVNRYNEEYIKKNRAYGELGHPQGPNINLERVSHMIKSLHREGNNYIGRAKILDTPYGKIVKELIEDGAGIGVSTRGLGTVRPAKEGYEMVQDDFRLATAGDIVADPSAPDAFVRGIMENVEFWYDEDRGYVAERIRDHAKKLTVRELEEQKFMLFHKFLEHMKSKV